MSVWDLSCYLYLVNKQRTPAAGEMMEWMERFSHFPCFKKPNTSGSIKQLNPCSVPAAVGKGMWAADPACLKQRATPSRCVLEREAETSVGDKHSFSAPIGRAVGISCWQQTHRAAEAQSQSSQGHLAAGRRTVGSVNRSLKGMSSGKRVYTIYYFQEGNENTDFDGRDFTDTEIRRQHQSQSDTLDS